MKVSSLILLPGLLVSTSASLYPITDAGQSTCYNYDGSFSNQVNCDSTGQDGEYETLATLYCDNEDGTVTDMNTGLMWTQDTYNMTYDEAVTYAAALTLGGYNDWRLPTIKELYTLIDFNGVTGSSEDDNTPYIDTGYFNVNYGKF